jgi:CheY-like chemotaxis protein
LYENGRDIILKYSILFVEDDPVYSDGIIKILRHSFSSEVNLVSDNKAAFDYLNAHKPDLIISDIVHRGRGTGIDLFNSIRANPKTSSIPMIIVSGNAKPDVELRLYREGIQGVLEKPFRVEEFIKLVSRVLDDKSDIDIGLINLGYESKDLDYKKDIDFDSRESRASLAKDVIAMANSGGGTVIIGVSEIKAGRFEKTGLSEERLADYETTKLGNALKKYIGSVISVTAKRIKYRSKNYIIIKVPSCDSTIAMALCDNEAAKLYQGRIYVRTNSAESIEVHESIEIARLIEKLVESKLRSRI